MRLGDELLSVICFEIFPVVERNISDMDNRYFATMPRHVPVIVTSQDRQPYLYVVIAFLHIFVNAFVTQIQHSTCDTCQVGLGKIQSLRVNKYQKLSFETVEFFFYWKQKCLLHSQVFPHDFTYRQCVVLYLEQSHRKSDISVSTVS